MTATARAPRRLDAGRARRHRSRLLLDPHPFGIRSRRRLALTLGLLPLVSGLLLGSAVADRAPATERISAAEAAEMGQAIIITRHDDLAVGLAEVRVSTPISVTRSSGADQLLALAPGASSAAIAGQIGEGGTALVLARADGSQIRVELPGLIAAAFAPDDSWLAVIDGHGALWRVAAADGAAALVARGPFIGQPSIDADGSIIALQVPSVEAPYRSTAVRIMPNGAMSTLTDEGLVYGTQPLHDGTLAVIAHRPSGTIVLRLDDGMTTTLAEPGPNAVNVAVARSADAVAWERSGEIFLQRIPAAGAERIAGGTHPRFAPDGSRLLVDLPSGAQLLDRNGDLVATFSTQLAFADCGECVP